MFVPVYVLVVLLAVVLALAVRLAHVSAQRDQYRQWGDAAAHAHQQTYDAYMVTLRIIEQNPALYAHVAQALDQRARQYRTRAMQGGSGHV